MKYGRFLPAVLGLLLFATPLFAQYGNQSDTQHDNQYSSQSDPDKSAPLVVFNPIVNLFGPEEAQFNENMRDVLFDVNRDKIRSPEAQQALRADAQWLQDHPDARFYIDGYADWRGGIIYNVDLAQRRAESVKDALVSMGIPEDRIELTTGWGKLYPLCEQQDESCWSRNRRVELSYIPSWWRGEGSTPSAARVPLYQMAAAAHHGRTRLSAHQNVVHHQMTAKTRKTHKNQTAGQGKS